MVNIPTWIQLRGGVKFAPLYKAITLTIQGKCIKYTRVYNAPNRFCTIFKQFEVDIMTIIDKKIFLSNYIIKTFPTKINT